MMNFEKAKEVAKKHPMSLLKKNDDGSYYVVDRNDTRIEEGQILPIEPENKNYGLPVFLALRLSKDEFYEDTVDVYCSNWIKTSDPIPEHEILPNDAYYFLDNNAGKITSATEQEVYKSYDGTSEDNFRLKWSRAQGNKADKDLIFSLTEAQFDEDGLAKWSTNKTVYGLVDKSVFLENLTSSKAYSMTFRDDILLFVPYDKREILFQTPNDPALFLIHADVFQPWGRNFWHVNDIQQKIYSDPTAQTLETNHFSVLLSQKDHYLLSNEKIIEHCAKSAEELTDNIVTYLLDYELHQIINIARKRVSRELHNFTYNIPSPKDEKIPPWLGILLSGNEEKHRYELYRTIQSSSGSEKIISICNYLESFIFKQEKGFSYERLPSLLEEHTSCSDSKKCFLFIFNFMGKDFLIGVLPEDLPAGGDGDIPYLDITELNPVFLKTELNSNNFLGKFYKRVTTVVAEMREYTVCGNICFRIAEYIEDVTESHLIKDDGLLKHVLRSRTPFHERRLLQLIGIPCRQALGDIFHHRMSMELKPLPFDANNRTFQSRDEVVYKTTKAYIELNKELLDLTSLEDLKEFCQKDNGTKKYNLLSKMAILKKIASFNYSPEETISKKINEFKKELDEQGHLLAGSLCNTVLSCSGSPINDKKSEKESKNWIKSFWDEIGECFPDVGPNWKKKPKYYSDEPSGYDNNYNDNPSGYDNKVNELNNYTRFVLSASFDRQITTFFDRSEEYMMPYDVMVWAINSVHRLQMIAALLQVCCGDWVCSHKHDNINSKRKVWAYRIAAVASPNSYRGRAGGQVPQPSSENHIFCLGDSCKHASPDATILTISQAFNFNKKSEYILQKMGWWFNGVMDVELNHHFRCSKCGRMMVVDREVKNLNTFKCTSKENGHDKGIYLSWCRNSSCSHTIDSRIDKKKCDNDYYICSACGECCYKHEKEKSAN